MALVKYGGGIVQMSGSMAGNTFARNRFGNYVRARTVPVNPNSERQTNMRAIISDLVEHWNDTLTADQRDAWNSYAAAIAWQNKLGETIHLSGFNHFVRANSLRLLEGTLAIVADGPVTLTLPDVDPTVSFEIPADGNLDLTYDDTHVWCDEDEAAMLIFAGQPQNATRNFFAGPWRYCASILGDSVAPPTSPEADITLPYTYSTGHKGWIYLVIVRADGRVSTKMYPAPQIAA